jgi:serine/threonine protein kinase
MSTVKDLSSNKILGKGGFGIVFEGVWCTTPVAIKRIALSDITSNEREEEALQRLDHPNVIKLLHVESDPMFR